MTTIALVAFLVAPMASSAASDDEDEQWMQNAKVLSGINVATGVLNLAFVVAQRGNKAAGGAGIASGVVSLLYFTSIVFTDEADEEEDKLYVLFGTGAATLVVGMYSFKMGRDRSSSERTITISPLVRVPTSSSDGYGGLQVRF